MKISVLGLKPFSKLIEEGFKKLGHKISSENLDLIFSNDPRGYKESLLLKEKNPKAILIFNILDIPWHMPNIEQQTDLLVKHFLTKADFVTAISFKVQSDIARFTSIKTKVIYNPIKDVYHDTNIAKDDSFLFVGRANDPVKRIKLVHDSLSKINGGLKKLKICGEQDPGFGNYLGYVSDKKLNELYNASKYVLLTSIAEGIGLPMIEAIVCGSLPITCSDNETAKEFLPSDFMCEPNTNSIVEHIEKLDKSYKIKQELAFKLGKKYKEQFNKVRIAENILSIIK